MPQFISAEGEDGENRILIAVNHNVIDVTRGRHLYGPGGPYDLYAGRDASRGLATFSVDANVVRETYDDLRFVTIVFITDKLQII